MEDKNKHPYRLLIILVFLFLMGVLAVLIYNRLSSLPIITGSLMTKTQETPAPVKEAFGSVTIKTSSNSLQNSLSDPLRLDILVNLPEVDVVGYDLLFDYDRQAFKLLQVDSALADFSLFKNEREEMLIVTGTKTPGATGKYYLTQTKLITLVFQPQKKGRFTIGLLGNKGAEKTQFVDADSKIHSPQTGKITVEIF